MRLELIGGAYSARSVIANAQKCINLIPEKNRADSPTSFTFYQRPGLRKVSSPPNPGIGRGVLKDSQGNGYAVVGQEIYLLAYSSGSWTWTSMGALSDIETTLVSISDNGVEAVLGDGSSVGYSWTILTPSSFAPIVDSTGIFTGTIKWDVIDGFLIWVIPDGTLFGSTYDNELTFDATYYGSKNGFPDPLVTLIVNRRIIILIGTVRSEIWYDSGSPLFPFSVQPGAYIQWGCIAPYSVAAIGIVVFWLGQNEQGTSVVLAQEGYSTSIVSNYAISTAIDQMRAGGIDISDAEAYTYTQGGHIFYVLTFIQGDQTWVYDYSIKDPEYAWHQRGWTDPNTGILHRERAISHCFLQGQDLTMDWETGDLYSLDPNYFFDDVGGISGPVSFVRTFSQVKEGYKDPKGPSGPYGRAHIPTDGHAVQTFEFVADFECGNGPQNPNGLPPQISLSYSTDRGRTWRATLMQSAGELGEYHAQPKWPPLGLARYPLFELSWSFGGKAALNGAWFEPVVVER